MKQIEALELGRIRGNKYATQTIGNFEWGSIDELIQKANEEEENDRLNSRNFQSFYSTASFRNKEAFDVGVACQIEDVIKDYLWGREWAGQERDRQRQGRKNPAELS